MKKVSCLPKVDHVIKSCREPIVLSNNKKVNVTCYFKKKL